MYAIICDQAGSTDGKLTATQLRSLFKDFLDPGYVQQQAKSLVTASKEVIEEVATKKGAHFITEKEFIAYVETVMGDYDEVLQIHLDTEISDCDIFLTRPFIERLGRIRVVIVVNSLEYNIIISSVLSITLNI